MNLSLLAVSGVENHRQMHVRVCGIAWYNPVQLISVLCFHRQDTYPCKVLKQGMKLWQLLPRGCELRMLHPTKAWSEKLL